jgi:hypothetical protein
MEHRFSTQQVLKRENDFKEWRKKVFYNLEFPLFNFSSGCFYSVPDPDPCVCLDLRIHDIFGEDPPYLDSDLSIFIIDLQDAN